MTMRMSIPVEVHQTSRTAASVAHGWLRLYLIELRRSPAIWAALLIAGITAFMMWDSLLVGVVRWREINNSAVEVPPLYASVIIGAFTAWQAGAIRQRHLLDQVGVTTFPGAFRELANILAVAVWGIAGYVAPVTGFYIYGAMRATWGGPDLIRPLVAISMILAASAFGWLVGTLVRYRIAPLAAVVLLLALVLADELTRNLRVTTIQTELGWRSQIHDGWWHHLVPNNVLTASYAGEIGFREIGWLLGLATVFWLLAIVVWHRSRSTMLALGAAGVFAIGFAASVVAFEPEVRYASNQAPFEELRCTTRLDDRITVCVHPENASLLDAAADAVQPIAAALAGVSGAPHEFINGLGADAYARGAVLLNVYDLSTLRNGQTQRQLVSDIILSPNRPPHEWVVTSPQHVVSAWLLAEAGQDIEVATQGGFLPPVRALYSHEQAVIRGLTLEEYFREQNEAAERTGIHRLDEDAIARFETDVDAALQRFVALPDDQRTAWFSANWDALIAGGLTLEDLP